MKLKTRKDQLYLHITCKDLYRKYKFDKRRNRRKFPPVPAEVATDIIEFIHKQIWYHMVKDLWNFKAPAGMGEFRVRESTRASGFYTNWGKTELTGKKEISYNMHSNGRKFYLFWDKSSVKLRNSAMYAFDPYQGLYGVRYYGRKGLGIHIKELSEDPTVPDYRAHIL